MAKQYFTQKAIMQLAAKYDLASEFKGQSLFERLEGCARTYFGYKNGIDRSDTLKTVRKELESIRSRAEKLKQMIEGADALSDTAQTAMRDVENKVQRAALEESINHPDTDDMPPSVDLPLPHGLAFTRIRVSDGGHAMILMDRLTIIDALKHLETYARAAKENLSGNTPGRRTSFSVRNWVSNIDLIWQDYKGERMRLTRIEGVIKSPSALFGIEALQAIDPEMPDVTIANAMREHIARERKAESAKNGSKN